MIDLSLDHVSKRYRLRAEDETHHAGLLKKIRNRFGPGVEFWAVKDICLEVPSGETLGIIGHNGSGKSTILKLLSRITAPTKGVIRTRGRVAALLEVASGFHPELTGRENVFLSGSIIGMRRREIHQKLESIVEFAEIRPFIDLPVKRYSSGMFVRLGFSIAAHMEPDILLLDEVLAVGDMGFQNKCIQHILRLKESGMTIVFISHDLSAVERLCDRAALLHRGSLLGTGSPSELVGQYLTRTDTTARGHVEDDSGPMRLKTVEFQDETGQTTQQFRTGYPLSAEMTYEASCALGATRFRLQFAGVDNQAQCEFQSGPDSSLPEVASGRGTVRFFCEELPLKPGIYHINARIESADGQELAQREHAALIHVAVGKAVHGVFYAPNTWRHSVADLEVQAKLPSTPGR